MVETTWSMTPSEIRSFIEPKLLQYLCSSDFAEVVRPISELGRPDLNPHLVEVLLIEGIERNVCVLLFCRVTWLRFLS